MLTQWQIQLILLCSMQSTSAILKENMDLYMLNPCSNKIWYVASLSFYPQMSQFSFSLLLNPVFYFFSTLFLMLRFIIELCEPIQVKQLVIANFELFSSTPKDFLVSISNRYAQWLCCRLCHVIFLISSKRRSHFHLFTFSFVIFFVSCWNFQRHQAAASVID